MHSGIVYSQNNSKLRQHNFYLLLPATDVSIYLIILYHIVKTIATIWQRNII